MPSSLRGFFSDLGLTAAAAAVPDSHDVLSPPAVVPVRALQEMNNTTLLLVLVIALLFATVVVLVVVVGMSQEKQSDKEKRVKAQLE